MMKHHKKAGRVLALAGLVTLLAFCLSLWLGRYPLVAGDILRPGTGSAKVFWLLRLPRSVMGLFAGFCLSAAGSVYQTVFKNPLASPDIIGVASGASAGAAVAILALGGGMLATTGCAFLGGMGAVAIALLLARTGRRQGLAAFVLSGIAVNALAQALLMTLKLAADPERQLASIEFWIMGSLAGVTAQQLPISLLLAALGAAGLFVLHRQIELLALSPEEARMLGVRVEAMQALVLLLATLAVSAIVSVTGLVSFVGLMGPHLARLIYKRGGRASLWLAGLVGACLLLLADCAARSLAAAELPLSILTSALGAPFLIWLMAKGEVRE